MRPDFAQAHRDVVVALLRQIQRAQTTLREQPEEAYKALAAVRYTTLATVTYAYEHKMVEPTDITPDKAAMIKQTKVLADFGVVSVPDIPAYINEFVHPEYAVEALKP